MFSVSRRIIKIDPKAPARRVLTLRDRALKVGIPVKAVEDMVSLIRRSDKPVQLLDRWERNIAIYEDKRAENM